MSTQFSRLIPSVLVEHIETPRWILILVCLTGVILAIVTEDSPATDHVLTADTKPVQPFAVKNVYRIILSETRRCFGYICRSFKAPGHSYIIIKNYYMWLLLCIKTKKILRVAKSKRHSSYLMQKVALNLDVRKSETEMDTYLDVKKAMAHRWPFMLEVGNVKAKEILCNGQQCVPMSSYSYLGLISNEEVQDAAIAAARLWSTGNHGPRMLGGNMTILRDLEKVVARFFNRDDALVCATGYLACMSACAAVSSERTVIFCDRRSHASLQAGMKIGSSLVVSFRHNDFEDCEQKMRKVNRKKYLYAWMVIESVYSMDGDIGDLPAAHRLCKAYDCKLLIDEAHGLGVLGETGGGLEQHFGMPGAADLIVGTFSKSIASIGGFICGDKNLISYMDFHAPGNVFSAPMPAYCAGGAIKSFELMTTKLELIKKLQENAKRMRSLLESGGGNWPADYPEKDKYTVEGVSASSVIPVVFRYDIDRVIRVAEYMRCHGFMCSPIAYPACPVAFPRLRVTATALYTEEIMVKFVKTFVEASIVNSPSEFVTQYLN